MKIKAVFPLAITLLLFAGCNKSEECVMGPTQARVGDLVFFTNCTKRPKDFGWYVGCGLGFKKEGDGIAVRFENSGNYRVRINAKNAINSYHVISIEEPLLDSIEIISVLTDTHVNYEVQEIKLRSENNTDVGFGAYANGSKEIVPQTEIRTDCKSTNSSQSWLRAYERQDLSKLYLQLLIRDTENDDTLRHALYTNREFQTFGTNDSAVVYYNDTFEVSLNFLFKYGNNSDCIQGENCQE